MRQVVMRWLGRRRRRIALVVVGVAALASLPGVLAPVASSAQATTGYDQTLLSECPHLIDAYPGSNPGGELQGFPATASFYGLPTAIRLHSGTLQLGSVSKATNVSATLCGYFILPTLAARVTPASQSDCPGCSMHFDPGSVTIAGLVTLPTSLAPAGPATSTVAPAPGPNGGLQLTVSTPVIATIKVPPLAGRGATGVSCTVGTPSRPIVVSVTTRTSGPYTGTALSGPLTGASAKVVGDQFPVPAVAPSTTCPASLVPATNGLAGLPLGSGQSSFVGQIDTINSMTLNPTQRTYAS